MMLIVTEGLGGVGHFVGLRSDHIWVTIVISLCQVCPIHCLINHEPAALQGLAETHTYTRKKGAALYIDRHTEASRETGR